MCAGVGSFFVLQQERGWHDMPPWNKQEQRLFSIERDVSKAHQGDGRVNHWIRYIKQNQFFFSKNRVLTRPSKWFR